MSSIPTPPFSPKAEQREMSITDHPLKNTINLLDALVSFYQHERMWVSRARAALDSNFKDSPMADVEHTLPSPTSESDRSLDEETENETESSDDTSSTSPPSTTKHNSRWLRRKKAFKLKLETASRRKRIGTLKALNANTSHQENIPQREQILEMFGKMMEDRLESCQRVHKLVRNANRADLHYR